jgi:hypothetical protein
MEVIEDITKFRAVRQVHRSHRFALGTYKTMRDHHEHFDERLPGRVTRTMKQPHDLGNSSRNTYSFGGDKIDISRKSLALLRRIVHDVRQAVKVEAWQKILKSKSDLADRVVKDFYRDRRLRAIRKQLSLP